MNCFLLKPSRYRQTSLSNGLFQIKSGAGQLVGLNILNPNGADVFVKFYDEQGGAAGGTDTPILTIKVPSNGYRTINYDGYPLVGFDNQLEFFLR